MIKNSKLYVFLSAWKHRLSYGFNIFKTIYINFTFLPFKQAISFPVFVYGKVKIYENSGRFIIEGKIRPGMIHLGMNTDKFSASKGGALINITGTMVFNGPVIFSVDYVFNITGAGICSIGGLTSVGNNIKICCRNKISVGKSCRIGSESQIFDTNFHFTRNVETGRVDRRDGIVEIGDYCWVGNRTTITKGARIPARSMISSNSLVNKNFIKENIKYPFIAGMPAKIVTSNKLRIFDPFEEQKLYNYFRDNPDTEYYEGVTGEVDEEKILEEIYNHY